ncbi:glycosyltransferase family 4 protein [Massilia phosphatilytica]
MRASCASRCVLLVARRAGCKTIFHLHGGGFRTFATEESGTLLRRWIRHTLEAGSLVITLSEGWAQFVHAFAPRARVAVVPNSVPLPDLPARDQSMPGRILFLGRLEAAKGVFELLEAGARIVRETTGPSPLRLVFGGDGDTQGLRRRAADLGIAERIELLGWVGPAERDAELRKATVFCLPSHAEGLPMSMLEAMAARKAVVATAVGGIPGNPARRRQRLAGAAARRTGACQGACTTPGRLRPARPAGGTSARNHRTTILNRGGVREVVRDLP